MNHLLTSNAYLHYLKYLGIGCTLMCAVPIFASSGSADAISVAIVQQQEERIEGTILGENGEPIIGASIVVEGTTNGVISDFDGHFELNVPRKATIIISYIGYKNQIIVIGKEKNLRIIMEEDTEVLDEVVVVGYGTTSKRKTTAAVATVNAENLTKVPSANITQTLAGQVPGVIVASSGGGIGKTSTISIRGGSTPLVVIDDVISEYRDFENLNPEDIEQMTILKDASATAVYGARAADGILLIVTKQGKAGKMSVNYNGTFSFTQLAEQPEKLDSYTAVSYVNQSFRNDGKTVPYTDEELEKYRTGSDPYNYPNTDWMDLALRDFAPEQKHTLSISGGSEKLKLFTGLSYYKQESLYDTNTNNLHRYNMRTNLVADFKEIGLKVTSGIDGYITNQTQPSSHFGTGYYYVWSHLQNKKPTELAYNKNGDLYQTSDNPLAEISPESGYLNNDIMSVTANLILDWAVPWLPGLKFKALGRYRINSDKSKQWVKTAPMYDIEGNMGTLQKPKLFKSHFQGNNWTTQFFANYDQTFNKVHTVGATIGIEANKSTYDNSSLSRVDYILDVDQMGAGPVSTAKNSSAEGEAANAAVIARIKYDYASKYVAEASMRYDGSDLFPEDKRWGTFFSGSLAWVISEEGFWQTLKERHIFDTFKIRGSYGEIGQSNIERYAYLQSYNLEERGYYIGGQWMPGFSEGGLVSKDISWYSVKDMNIGIDFGSLNNRLSGSIDYFRKVTTGYLASPSNVNYTAPLGTALPYVKTNGEHIRQGLDFIIQWKEERAGWKYGISANLTYFDAFYNINPFESEADLKNPYKRTTQAKGYWGIGYECEGFYRDQEDIINSPIRQGSVNLGAGDLKYKDFNGDGLIDGDDQHRIGKNGFPRANYGINFDVSYKGWFANMLWQGATSRDMYMGDMIQGLGQDKGYLPVIYDFMGDTWTPDNTDAKYPRLRSSGTINGNNNYTQSDFWLINGAYLRLKTLNVGYDFKHKLLKKTPWITKCTLALSGYNLFTISPATKYGMDPEIGNTNFYDYPTTRTYAVSLNIGF